MHDESGGPGRDPTSPGTSICLPGLPAEAVSDLQAQLRRPRGALGFDIPASRVLNFTSQFQIICQVVAGNVLCRLERRGTTVHYIHSSPGTGTRIASISLAPMVGAPELRFTLTWSSQDTAFQVQMPNSAALFVAEGTQSEERELYIATSGSVVELGAPGVRVMGARIRVAGQVAFQVPAIRGWREVKEATRLVLDHIHTDVADLLLKTVLSNQAFAMMVTGYEVYCKTRFVEMVGEGRKYDFDQLAQRVFTRVERSKGIPEAVKQEAAAQSLSPIEVVVRDNRINFQSYDESKRAYSRAYSISYAKMGLSSALLHDLNTYLGYRHRVSHVSPFLAMVNEADVQTEQPIFSYSGEVGTKALRTFDMFVEALHKATLDVPAP